MEMSRYEIYPKQSYNYDAQLFNNFNSIVKVENIKKGRCYLIENMNESEISHIKDDVFYDEVIEEFFLDNKSFREKETEFDYFVDVKFRPGVTDNPAKSCQEAINLYNLKCEVYSSEIFLIKSAADKMSIYNACKVLIGNELIQEISINHKDDDELQRRFTNINPPIVDLKNEGVVDIIDLENMSENDLLKLSQDRCLALNLKELNFIKTRLRDFKKSRLEHGLPHSLTDVELEVIAQTWSEHCKHKIFSSKITFTDENNETKEIDSLYKTYIKASTKKIKQERKLDWLTSVFTDNAGIVRFDDNIDLCIKVETHNSPSALDPYGGALTGILGVNRDILGCGLGAKPIANMDVFCFANPNVPENIEESLKLPRGIMDPIRIFEGVHKGVEDGGNKSGVPTVNGSMLFDRDYAGKPLVFVGTVGVMPQSLNDGRKIEEKTPDVGDYIVMTGGAVGADGIHGATFSSLELNDSSPSTAVQIGDPLTQKRVTDFLIAAREECLFSSVTDNGAGGLSSSVGEMATYTNGAKIDLKKCPTKYKGLSPYELMISESQERMTFAVPAKNKKRFLALSQIFNVESTVLGHFHDKGNLEIFYGDERVGLLDLKFLHEELPQMELSGNWNGPSTRNNWLNNKKIDINIKSCSTINFDQIIMRLLKSPNIASKEKYVRRYDHEVQAATIVKPFNGENSSGPSNAGGIWLHPHGGQLNNGVMISNGIAPRVSLSNPYLMAQMAVDEALRNVVSQGGDPDHCALLDNFCWPDPEVSKANPDGDYKLGQLVKACQGLFDITTLYGTPLVSGKDSMKNDFRGVNRKGEPLKISVLPTLLITAMAKCQVNHIVTSEFKKSGDSIYLLGDNGLGLLRSELLEYYNFDHKFEDPQINMKENINLYRKIYKAIQNDLLESCHDISDGGLILALVESCFGNELGANLKFESFNNFECNLNLLFNESAGRFIISVNKKNETKFLKYFKDSCTYLGEVEKSNKIKHEKLNINLSVNACLNTWKGALL